MRVSAKQLKEMIRRAVKSQLRESAAGSDDSDKELNSFLGKVDKTLADCRETLSKLIEEGEELAIKDLQKKDRNAAVVMAVGMLKKVHGVCVHSIEHIKKHTG